jgi:hypothetical protein
VREFVAFITIVVNGTAQILKKFRKIDIVSAAELILDLKDLTSEELHITDSCSPTLSGPRA